MIRVAIVTNEPPPYRIPIFGRVGRTPGITLQVIFCTRREPNRRWDLPPFEFDHRFLRERVSTVKGRYIHNNPDVIAALRRFSPDVVVTDGFNPTQLYAFGYTWVKGLAHVPLTDGTVLSEQTLTRMHKAIRRFVYAHSDAFISASMGGRRLFESYGISPQRCFKSCLCIDNDLFSPALEFAEKRYDFIFSGRIEPVKNPLFALEVARETARRLGRKVSILFIGSGSEEERVRTAAAGMTDMVHAYLHGFAMQKELPALYRSSRLFLFPTKWDPWGVVANEACAAGLPVIASPHAGVAGELVLDGENGFVCELDVNLWAERAAFLLAHGDIMEKFSRRSLVQASEYTFEVAASGLVDACRHAVSDDEQRRAGGPVLNNDKSG